jgi:hypothetical protein
MNIFLKILLKISDSWDCPCKKAIFPRTIFGLFGGITCPIFLTISAKDPPIPAPLAATYIFYVRKGILILDGEKFEYFCHYVA